MNLGTEVLSQGSSVECDVAGISIGVGMKGRST